MSNLSLFKHPLLYYKHKWQRHRFKYSKLPDGVAIKEINGVKFPIDPLFKNWIKYFYFDYYEPTVVRIMKKYLKSGGVFIDIGANVGYLSSVGASLVGERGQVHCFEPIPKYFDHIKKTAALNPNYIIVANNNALGEETTQVSIADHREIGGSSIVPGFVSAEDTVEILNINIQRLDEYTIKNDISNISLIKIDTEGFELSVLKGASGFLDEHRDNAPPIIVEITPKAFKLMNKDISELEDFMCGYGYKSYSICGCHRLDIKKLTEPANVLFKP